MKQKFYFLVGIGIISAIVSIPTLAEDSGKSTGAEREAIFNELATPDSITGAYVKITQNEQVTQMMEIQKPMSFSVTQKGYRVQVFSSNNSQNARDLAFKIEKNLLDKIPNLETYIIYAAPFWKVRVGNCSTHEQAQQLRESLIDTFPEYQTEMYIVPDQIIFN